MVRVAADYVPAYRLHKASGQAIVTLSQKDHLLGLYGSPESRARYHTLIAQWIKGGRKPLSGIAAPANHLADKSSTVATLCDAFQRHADVYYANPVKRSNAAVVFKMVLADVRDLFGSTPADDFSPSKLKAVRDRWIQRGYVRRSINQYVGHIRHVFRWGVAEEIVSPNVVLSLECVRGLSQGKTPARESVPVKPVPDAYMEAIEPYVASPVWGMVQLQRLTGARGDELFRLRAIDIDTSGEVWLYSPASHKTATKGKMRFIPFGPKAQAVLRPFMASRPVDAYLFSPREANAERKAANATKGKRRRPGQPASKRKSKRTIRDTYTDDTYRKVIQRACKEAGIPRWHPHQLRHSFTTNVNHLHGLDAARAAAGHATIDATLIYAERDKLTAMRIAAEVG